MRLDSMLSSAPATRKMVLSVLGLISEAGSELVGKMLLMINGILWVDTLVMVVIAI